MLAPADARRESLPLRFAPVQATSFGDPAVFQNEEHAMKQPRYAAAIGRGIALIGFSACTLIVRAEEVKVAVAANFAGPMEKIAADFAHDTGHAAVVSVGSTGKFYAQIKNGAPFEVLLAADQATPQKLQDEGLGVADQRFTYAVGTLVLFSARPGFVDDAGKVLQKGQYEHLALANPTTAPYGAAGLEVIKALGLLDAVRSKIVQGDSIGQAFEFVATGNAELGFVALSQVAPPGKTVTGSWWVVPQSLYTPIRQDAVLLKDAANHAAARAFMDYLRTDRAKAVIRSYGYGT
jgi:molybdate transport system substrate-binding protein